MFQTGATYRSMDNLPILRPLQSRSSPGRISSILHRHLEDSLEDIRKAWAYFFSAQITLEFYQYPAHREFVPEGFQASQYLRSIEHFISKKTREAVNHYHLILLLYLVHKAKGKDGLEFLHHCLVNPLGTWHYLLQKTLEPLKEKENLQKRLDQMPRHRDTLLYAYQKSWQESSHQNS